MSIVVALHGSRRLKRYRRRARTNRTNKGRGESKRWLRFLSGKRIFLDVLSEKFRDWDVGQFADALVLRSLRAVPGVWRMPVWEQAEDINSECFSFLE